MVYDAAEQPHFQAVLRDSELTGPLLSFVLKDAERFAPALHDALQFCKGPSLGCDFTLVCPFTQLAHYHELAWATEQGVSPWLLRVSVGCEDPAVIIERFSNAFAVVFAE